MSKETLYPHVPKSKTVLLKFVETKNVEGGLDRAVEFSDAQNNPLARVSFGNVNELGIVVQTIEALGRQLDRVDFFKIICSIEELALKDKRPVVWIQSRATDTRIYQKLGYNFDKVTGTYVKHVLGGKVPDVKYEDVMFLLPQTINPSLLGWVNEPLPPEAY